MELQKIRELIDVLKASDLAELEYAQGEYRLRLVRRSISAPVGTDAMGVNAPPNGAVLHHDANTEPESAGTTGVLVRSPLFGILHLKASPEGSALVQLGATVQKGETLCIVEAMKIFHEVKADRAARVEAIFGTSGEEVEAGAPLFQLHPLD